MDKQSLRKKIREQKRAMTPEQIEKTSEKLGELFCASELYRNANREYPVPETVIGNMLRKLSVPEIHEACKVEWINI